MAELTNQRHEEYCLYRAKGLLQYEAYSKVYTKAKNPSQSASRLEKEDNIKERINELRGELFKELRLDDYYIYKNYKDALNRLIKLAEKSKKFEDVLESNKTIISILMSFISIRSGGTGELDASNKYSFMSEKELDKAIKNLGGK